jgi:ATP-dependent DNA helicase RecG
VVSDPGQRSAGPRRLTAPRPAGAALLDTPVGRSGLRGATQLRRVGGRLGIGTVRDLLFHLPRRYDDLRQMRTVAELHFVPDGEAVSARVRVAELTVQPTFRRRVQRTVARLEDSTGSLDATWFGRRFIERRLRAGDEIVVSGKVRRFGRRLTLDNPEFQRDDGTALLHAGRIVPVYRLTAGVTVTLLRAAVRGALDAVADDYPEYLPEPIRLEERLDPIGRALEAAHFPVTFEGRDAALRRLAFDELLALQVGMVGRRRQRIRSSGRPVAVRDEADRRLRDVLAAGLSERLGRLVSLTPDQEQAIGAIRADLGGSIPMLRLLQGDVGSGKTAVAAWALAAVALEGHQAALLAPTDLLARQHARTLGDLLAPLSIPVDLLTGSMRAADARAVRDRLASGMTQVVIGTHALFQESVAFHDLALAIVDEQHRFGVAQRAGLEAKAPATAAPHVLLMTATPIPRTLGQVIYADLDVVDLRAAPTGRIPVRTGVRHPDDLDGTWARVREEAAAGGRTFVVVPLIDDESGDDSAAAASSEAERLRELLGLRVGLVHGRMRPGDRDAEMARFRDGELDVLVGTTVVEVGVDVPEATMMIVESAERFGLAQLHQLRGRVGRGSAAAYCVLVSPAAPSSAAWRELVRGERPPETTEQARLVAVATTGDGFELAERDWELRREGDVLGLAQSGLPGMRVASLARPDHRELAARARAHAESLLGDDGALRPGMEALGTELAAGWLADLAAGEPEEEG